MITQYACNYLYNLVPRGSHLPAQAVVKTTEIILCRNED